MSDYCTARAWDREVERRRALDAYLAKLQADLAKLQANHAKEEADLRADIAETKAVLRACYAAARQARGG